MVLAINKRAKFDYEILDTFEAGIVLTGQEVKAVKTGHLSLKGSFVAFKKTNRLMPELYLLNAYIPPYKPAGLIKNYDPSHSRKLLLHKKELENLIGKQREKGLTLVPLSVYTKNSLIKLEFASGKGKSKIDKRETIKKRELNRRILNLKKNY